MTVYFSLRTPTSDSMRDVAAGSNALHGSSMRISSGSTANARATSNPWAVKLQILNNQNVTASVFNPFDLVQLRANVSYNNASQPDVLVSFNIIGPSANPIKITRIETTKANGEAEFSFRLPIEAQNVDSLIGTWNVTATINNATPKTSSFTAQWNIETVSISLLNSKGQNQTEFSPVAWSLFRRR